MLTQVMSNLLSGFRVALESIHNNPRQIVLNKNATSLVKNNTHHIKTKESHNAILSLKSPDMFQTSNLTEG